MQHLIYILGLFILISCRQSTDNSEKTKRIGENQFGLFLENGPRQGFNFIDSIGTLYDYRYFTETITNDSTICINLEISFSKEYNDMRLNDSLMSKVFLLPRKLT